MNYRIQISHRDATEDFQAGYWASIWDERRSLVVTPIYRQAR